VKSDATICEETVFDWRVGTTAMEERMTTTERNRRILHHVLTVTTPEGFPAVSEPQLLLELSEWVDDAWNKHVSPYALSAWARYGLESREISFAEFYLHCSIDVSYRVMVGAFYPSYPIEWLCVAPSVRWGCSEFPAWDRFWNRIV